MKRMIGAILVVLLLLMNVQCHNGDDDHDEHEHDESTSIDALRSLFVRYSGGRTQNSITKSDLNTFLNNLVEILNTTTTNRTECFASRVNSLTMRMNDTGHVLNERRFNKLSSYLLANIDDCYGPVMEHTSDEPHSDGSNRTTSTNAWTHFSHKFVHNVLRLKKEVWIYAFVSVTVISIVGVVCVAIVPVLDAFCFSYLFQFLTALALGTLCGDALIHLIPHAFMEHDHKASNEDEFDKIFGAQSNQSSPSSTHMGGIYKGLAAVFGIYAFFLIEGLTKLRAARKRKQKQRRRHSHSSYTKVNGHLANATSKIKSQLEHGAESNELIQHDKVNDLNEHQDSDKNVGKSFSKNKKIHQDRSGKYVNTEFFNDDQLSNYDNTKTASINGFPLAENTSDSRIFNEELDAEFNDHKEKVTNKSIVRKNSSHGKKKMTETDDEEKLENKHKRRNSPPMHGHNHSHHHGHEHGFNTSILMIILGDGLHNFSDGLAIGASFASSLTTGFGTTIAVFFHELPHEMGDFAVLKKNGLSIKRAILFNVLSSILCFLGVVIGLVIGSIDFISDWTFLFIAGTFIYISLVNIIPELSDRKHNANCLFFLLQNCGILLGFAIMFLIAIFEDDIINLFEAKQH